MIKLLKNKEVRKALLWQMLLSAAACAVCFFFDIRAGLTAAGLSLLLMLVFCISTYKRYQRISSLADDINQVLHGDSSIDFDSYSEGELSILHSEIYKMTKGKGISCRFHRGHLSPDPHTPDLYQSADWTAVGAEADRCAQAAAYP